MRARKNLRGNFWAIRNLGRANLAGRGSPRFCDNGIGVNSLQTCWNGPEISPPYEICSMSPRAMQTTPSISSRMHGNHNNRSVENWWTGGWSTGVIGIISPFKAMAEGKMSRDDFFKKLPDAATADATRALEAYCTEQTGLNAYWTEAAGSPFRVRLWQDGRVVLTVSYQTRNKVFLCRSYCLPGTIVGMGVPADRVSSPKASTEPLRSEFRLTPEEYCAHLQAIALAAGASFRNENGVA